MDAYVLDVLMRDLVRHDRAPSAYLVYLCLWGHTRGNRRRTARLSHQAIADMTGLSKTTVQAAIRRLLRRRLLSVSKASATATPEYRVHRAWVRQ